MRKLAVALLVLAVLLVLADRGAAVLAGRAVAAAMAQQGARGAHAEVLGMPFLNQLAVRRFSHVLVDARSMRLDGGTLSQVAAELGDVTVRSRESAVAGWLRGTALVPFRVVEQQGRLPAGSLSDAGGGRVGFDGPVEVLGVTVPAVATARVTVQGTDLLVTPESVSLAGVPNLAARFAGPVRSALTVRVRVSGLPSGLRLEAVAVAPRGLRVTVSGRDVPLGR